MLLDVPIALTDLGKATFSSNVSYNNLQYFDLILILAGHHDKIKVTIKCDERTLSATVQTLPIIVYYSLLIKPIWQLSKSVTAVTL